ncbi:MAG: L,D-transpeptidase family protein [Rhodothermales bacterium]
MFMRRGIVLFLLILLIPIEGAVAQPATSEGPLMAFAEAGASVYYVVKRRATVYTRPDSGRAYLQLGFREPVFVMATEGNWKHIRTQDGAQGYVESAVLSNIWIRVSKRQKTLYLYRGTELFFKVPADFGYNAYADKERRGSTANPDHWRTPEGTFFVVRKNPYSKFYKAFVLNYPTAEDADRGLKQGIITREQHAAIVQAEATFSTPPMSTALGGMIEIHGDGTGSSSNWTQGCVAVHNDHIDRLWQWVEVGTPVLVEK